MRESTGKFYISTSAPPLSGILQISAFDSNLMLNTMGGSLQIIYISQDSRSDIKDVNTNISGD